jgi:hypothetical protein
MRYRFTFSVLGLLVVVLLAAVIIGNIVNSRRLHEAEQELRALRRETGHLTVEDRTKFHAIAVPMDELNTWRWRVFLPKGHRYSWHIATKEIPQNDVPKRGSASYSNEPYWERDNEVLVTATLRKTDDGNWRLAVSCTMSEGNDRLSGTSHPIRKEELAWMSEVPCTDGQVLGERGIVVRDPEGPFIFLQRRPCEKQADGKYLPSPNPMPGFMIWLQKS